MPKRTFRVWLEIEFEIDETYDPLHAATYIEDIVTQELGGPAAVAVTHVWAHTDDDDFFYEMPQ